MWIGKYGVLNPHLSMERLNGPNPYLHGKSGLASNLSVYLLCKSLVSPLKSSL